MRRRVFACLALLACGAAAADDMFGPAPFARRVERIVYADEQVIQIGAIEDHPFLIEFGADELLEDVAGGTIAGWDVHKKGARLFVLARKDAKSTTLLATTNKHSYVFDLTPKPATAGNLAQRRSKIIFSYPAPPEPPPPPPALPEPPAYRNAQYSMQLVATDADIRPSEVYDDGRFTWFRFAPNVEVPAIYRSTPGSRDEMLVNRHVDGDYVVMHATAALWNLRLAGSMIGVFNDRHDGEGEGAARRRGTTVPGVSREVLP
jgi:type IV secretion system protein VirB9